MKLDSDWEQAQVWRHGRAEIAAAPPPRRAALLHERAQETRRQVLAMIRQAGLGHIGGDYSVVDVLTVLFWGVLRFDPQSPDDPDRDRFVLSKGHCAASLYATLASCGFFPVAQLGQFMKPGSGLSGHPNRREVPGVETNTGPLGHGLPVAVGLALGARQRARGGRTFVIVGDGELQEGSNWEALMSAAHYRLSDLTVIVDRNGLQQGARTEDTVGLEPLADKLTAFGCQVVEVDGHAHGELYDLLGSPGPLDRPRAVIAHTTKGRGVSFMEDRVEWHHKVPSQEQAEQALRELVEA